MCLFTVFGKFISHNFYADQKENLQRLNYFDNKMINLNDKTVFVLDHTQYFGISGEHLLDLDFGKTKGNTITLPPISKSLWTCSVESSAEYCRIVWDLFPTGKLVRNSRRSSRGAMHAQFLLLLLHTDPICGERFKCTHRKHMVTVHSKSYACHERNGNGWHSASNYATFNGILGDSWATRCRRGNCRTNRTTKRTHYGGRRNDIKVSKYGTCHLHNVGTGRCQHEIVGGYFPYGYCTAKCSFGRPQRSFEH